MDIDDILAAVDADADADTTRRLYGQGYRGPSDGELRARDLQELTRAWVAERSAPEVLVWPAELMARVGERVRRQIELVEEQTGDMDPKTNFRLIIIQTELERFKFLVRSYLRARLAKIDKYALYYLSSPEQRERLSPSEQQYAASHQALLHAHYYSSFLSQFPPALQRLDDTKGGISMIEQPDLDRAVFVRALRDSPEEIVVEGTDMAFEMRRGDIFVVRWRAVRESVERGDAELL